MTGPTDGGIVADLGFVAAVVLAATFAVAAVAKLCDPAGTARGFADLGVPHPWVVARTVPLVECAVGVTLLVVPVVGAALATVVLAAFTVFLVDRLRSGVRAACSCFGGARRHQLTVADPVRNVFLVAVALLAGSAGRPGVPAPVAVVVGGAGFAAGSGAVAVVRRRALRRR